MNLLKELEGLEEKEDILVQLKRETLPLVMWGAGSLAIEIKDFLKNKGIFLADIFVDDEYYCEGMMMDGKNILSYSELIKKYAEVNIILGNSNYEKISMLENRKGVNKVFYFFSINYGIYEKTPISDIQNNIDGFETVYQMLGDEISRENYMAFLKTRVSGNYRYILDVYKKECNFFRNDIFTIGENEVFLDVGAFDGDTIRIFLKENGGKYRAIYALEPDSINRNKLEKFIEDSQMQNVFVSDKGAWDKAEKLSFLSNLEQMSGVIAEAHAEDDGTSIIVDTLDTLFQYSDDVTILKINYREGVKEALNGAKYILKNHKPKLAIVVGFDCQNIVSIPQLIKDINPDYKLYMRYNRGMISTLTLYGIV